MNLTVAQKVAEAKAQAANNVVRASVMSAETVVLLITAGSLITFSSVLAAYVWIGVRREKKGL